MKEIDFGIQENHPEIWIAKITESTLKIKEFYLDETRPLIHNEFLYKSIVKGILAYFKNVVNKYQNFE